MNKAQAEVNKTTLEIQKNINQLKDLNNTSQKASNEVSDLGDNFKKAGNDSSSFADIVKGNVLADFIVDGIKRLAEWLSTWENHS